MHHWIHRITCRFKDPLKLAEQVLQAQQWSQALALCARARRQHPEDWRGYAQACIAHRQLGQWAQAHAVLEQGLQRLGARIIYFPYTQSTSSTLINQTLERLRTEAL
ncbi:MAG: tetratricopeptide repeat protein [Comamonadaceae bacterium]|nr:tetratricopeptide repeat protein [Comamonadaceae bacterium]